MDFDITPGYLMRLIRQIEKPHYHPASMPSAGRLASPITKIVK
jgi:hypothetical protein